MAQTAKDKKLIHGSVGKANELINKEILNNQKIVEVQKPWPGLMKTLTPFNQKQWDTYFKKNFSSSTISFCMFDYARENGEGEVFIEGRTDDAIKHAGKLIYSGEVESLVLQLENIKSVASEGIGPFSANLDIVCGQK